MGRKGRNEMGEVRRLGGKVICSYCKKAIRGKTWINVYDFGDTEGKEFERMEIMHVKCADRAAICKRYSGMSQRGVATDQVILQ